MMATAIGLQSKSIKKYVLQQSNCNLETTHDREEDPKLTEKNSYGVKMKEDVALETENRCSPQKVSDRGKSDAKKLRSVRLDLSSLKRGVIQKSISRGADVSSGESSEDEARSRRKPRPVVPNYVTNSDGGPCRKPRQSRQEPPSFSSHPSPKTSSQSLSIARRNARERNRVKQVNEGFATLRSRIPDYISEAYNEEKGRKTAKKLSKVETLRMAVDYIRHLETLLDLKATDGDVWMRQIKIEDRPWDTPNSEEYPSPRYRPPESPGAPYDQTFEYQDRIFYDYDLDFTPRKDASAAPPEKRPTAFPPNGHESENQCVDDFKYYETFNRIKKEGGDNAGSEEDKGPGEQLEGPESGGTPPHGAPNNPPTVLPPITESFNKTIPPLFF